MKCYEGTTKMTNRILTTWKIFEISPKEQLLTFRFSTQVYLWRETDVSITVLQFLRLRVFAVSTKAHTFRFRYAKRTKTDHFRT
jgi:hypothetical protein